MKALRLVFRCTALGALALVVSCASPKAFIDHSMSGGIIWPGPPERPRIKYLWSLQQIKGAEGGSLARYIAGDMDYDIEDPRDSDLLVSPRGVFVDSKDIIYITDPGAMRVNVVNLENGDSLMITKMGDADMVSPIGVAAAPDGRIYVADSELRAVGVFSAKGKFLKRFEGGFNRPTGIAIGPAGTVYVVDTWDHKVYMHDLDGKRIGSFGSQGEAPGEMNYPTFIAVDRKGDLYLSDTLNFRVQTFTPTGKVLSTFGLIGDSYATFDKIKGIAVDSMGHIYVVDSIKDMVQIYDGQGRLLLFFGKEGEYYGDFRLPSGIYVDGKDRIFVSDGLNMRVQAFQFLGGEAD